MMARILEADDTAEQIRAAFADPVGGGEMVPYAQRGAQITTSDGIITAQKVAVERDLAKIMQNIKVMASAAGDDWYYRFPVRSQGGRDWIEGPSIKCANNVARMYGNCQVDTRVVDTGDSWIIYARFVDYETGFSYTRPFQQRKNQGTVGTKDVGRALDMALQIGVSKAIRNVVCNALETFTTYALDEAKKNVVEKVGKDIVRYRKRVLDRLSELKIDPRRVETVIGRAANEWLAPDIARIIAQLQAVQDGMANADDIWPGAPPPPPTREEFKKEQQPEKEKQSETPAPAEEPFALALADGGERAFASPDEAAVAMDDELRDAAKARGYDGSEGVWESNGALISALRSADRADLAEALHATRNELVAKYHHLGQNPGQSQDRTRAGAQQMDPAGGATDPTRAEVVDPERKPSEAHSGAVDEAGGSSEANARPTSGGRRDGGERPATASPDHPGDEGQSTLIPKGESQEVVADPNIAPPRGAVIAEIVPDKLKSGGMDWAGYAERVLAEYRRIAPGARQGFRRANAPHMTLLRSADRDASTTLQVEMGQVDEASRQ